MSVALNDVCIWRDLLKNLPDLYDDGALLQVRIHTLKLSARTSSVVAQLQMLRGVQKLFSEL